MCIYIQISQYWREVSLSLLCCLYCVVISGHCSHLCPVIPCSLVSALSPGALCTTSPLCNIHCVCVWRDVSEELSSACSCQWVVTYSLLGLCLKCCFNINCQRVKSKKKKKMKAAEVVLFLCHLQIHHWCSSHTQTPHIHIQSKDSSLCEREACAKSLKAVVDIKRWWIPPSGAPPLCDSTVCLRVSIDSFTYGSTPSRPRPLGKSRFFHLRSKITFKCLFFFFSTS